MKEKIKKLIIIYENIRDNIVDDLRKYDDTFTHFDKGQLSICEYIIKDLKDLLK